MDYKNKEESFINQINKMKNDFQAKEKMLINKMKEYTDGNVNDELLNELNETKKRLHQRNSDIKTAFSNLKKIKKILNDKNNSARSKDNDLLIIEKKLEELENNNKKLEAKNKELSTSYFDKFKSFIFS